MADEQVPAYMQRRGHQIFSPPSYAEAVYAPQDFGASESSMVTIAQPPVSAEQIRSWSDETDYSEKYCDDVYEYRRVTVPRGMLQVFPRGRPMFEAEWRGHGITMSRGWQHYDSHSPEANVLLFRRVLGTDPRTGDIPLEMMVKVEQRQRYIEELEEMRQRVLTEQQRVREQPFMDVL
eukprot:TRINITY_DN10663_c0_g1_i1.p2 TRINITY_DN10663_c0_g1~~TRINITY_DN10663_c0_g1_i1.p2  ORF type:complete len:200 (-),score=37.19 TRINITY_DN10663_c0_g1_i1:86-619(-)